MNNIEEPRFYSAEEIFKYAFYCEAMREGVAIDLLKDKNKKQCPGPDDPDWEGRLRDITAGLDRKETIADGIMLKNRAMRIIDAQLYACNRYAITTQYRHLVFLIALKYEISFLCVAIKKEKPKLGYWFIDDVVKTWAGRGHKDLKPQHSLLWWAKHLGKPRSTIYRWANSSKPSDKSINYLLNQWQRSGLAVVEKSFKNKLIIY